MLGYLLLLLSILFPFCQSSGYVELSLKSVIDLPNATFHINYYWNHNSTLEKKVYDISLVANKTRVVTGIPVNFTNSPVMFINTGPVNKYGFHGRKVFLHCDSHMKIAEEKVVLPFSGLKMEFACDRNWHGLDCDYFCNNDYATIVGRRCTQNGTVGCPLGFRGHDCGQPIDQKAPECQCQNAGICVSSFKSPLDLKDDFFCECPIGWYGQKCEHEDHPGLVWHSTYDENGGFTFKSKGIDLVDNEFYEK